MLFFRYFVRKIISVRKEDQSKNAVTVFSRHFQNSTGKIRTLYIQVTGSKWFSLLKKNMEKNETRIIQSLVKVNLKQWNTRLMTEFVYR